MKRNIVLDTNCLLSSISKKSKSYIVWKKMQEGAYNLCVTTEILNEYQEIIGQHTTPELAQNVIMLLLSLDNVKLIQTYYRFQLIKNDPDDNKFVDCAIAANATFIVTNDNHFKELDTIDFPHVDYISLDDFVKRLKK